jgi:hypothetical protein
VYDGGDGRLREGSDEEGDVTNGESLLCQTLPVPDNPDYIILHTNHDNAVGLSRNATQDPRKDPDIGRSRSRRSRSQHRASQNTNTGTARPTTGTITNDRLSVNAYATHDRPTSKSKGEIPFSPEELEIALRKSHLDSPKEDSGDDSPGSPGAPVPMMRPREIQFAPTPAMNVTPPEHA